MAQLGARRTHTHCTYATHVVNWCVERESRHRHHALECGAGHWDSHKVGPCHAEWDSWPRYGNRSPPCSLLLYLLSAALPALRCFPCSPPWDVVSGRSVFPAALLSPAAVPSLTVLRGETGRAPTASTISGLSSSGYLTRSSRPPPPLPYRRRAQCPREGSALTCRLLVSAEILPGDDLRLAVAGQSDNRRPFDLVPQGGVSRDPKSTHLPGIFV